MRPWGGAVCVWPWANGAGGVGGLRPDSAALSEGAGGTFGGLTPCNTAPSQEPLDGAHSTADHFRRGGGGTIDADFFFWCEETKRAVRAGPGGIHPVRSACARRGIEKVVWVTQPLDVLEGRRGGGGGDPPPAPFSTVQAKPVHAFRRGGGFFFLGGGEGGRHDACADRCPLTLVLSLTPPPPQAAVPIGLSPPSARDLPVCPPPPHTHTASPSVGHGGGGARRILEDVEAQDVNDGPERRVEAEEPPLLLLLEVQREDVDDDRRAEDPALEVLRLLEDGFGVEVDLAGDRPDDVPEWACGAKGTS